MGKGKGVPKLWIARVPAGKSIIQLNYIPNMKHRRALQLVRKILPMPTKIISNIAIKRCRTAFIKHVL